MLEVDHVTKMIGRQVVLDDISFSVSPGTITGIIGRNGVGKTTLLRTMTGILIPETGDVRYGGKSIFAHPREKENIIFVPDSKLVLTGYTAEQTAGLYGMIYPNFDPQAFAARLDRFSLPAGHKTGTFSKGMKALLAMILAFSARVETVLLDEPIDGLDPIAKRQCLEMLIEEVAERQLAAVISSHRLEELESVCDRIIMLKDGAVQSVTDLEDMQERYRKYQVVYDTAMPEDILRLPNIRLLSRSGRIYTIIIERDTEKTLAALEETHPLLIDPIPFRLEDLFVAELGGENLVR